MLNIVEGMGYTLHSAMGVGGAQTYVFNKSSDEAVELAAAAAEPSHERAGAGRG